MVIYVLIAFFLLIGGLSRQKKIIYRVGFVTLFLLTALRNPMLAGSDYYAYSSHFSAIPSLLQGKNIQDGYFEVGFNFLNAFVKIFSGEYVLFQISYSVLIFLLMSAVIKELQLTDEQKCQFLFSFFCFHFIWDTWVILRQNIADWIFWLLLILTYKCPNNKKTAKSILVIFSLLLPMLFHTTAKFNIIFFPTMLIIGKISSKKRMILIPSIALFLFLVGDKIYNWVLALALPYLRWDMAKYTATESNPINFFIRLAFFVLFAWRYDVEEHPQKKMILDTFTMMVLIGSFNNVVTTRMYEYYAIGMYASMSLILNAFEKKSKMIASCLYGFAMIFILVRFVLTFDAGQAFVNYSLFF